MSRSLMFDGALRLRSMTLECEVDITLAEGGRLRVVSEVQP
jgi:hypothetical protein